MPNTIDELAWISRKLHTDCRYSIDSILNFTIFWNLFENKMFSNDYKSTRISRMYSSNRNKILEIHSDTTQMLTFFKHRYYSEGVFTSNFESLHLRGSDDRQTIENVIAGTEMSEEKIFKSLITIIGRFRNNLFHGLKEPHDIIGQNEVFSYINSYLSKIIDL